MFKKRLKATACKGCDDCKCLAESPMTPKEAFRQQYLITLTLGESFYNGSVDRYLFANPTNGKVIVSKDNVVSFTTEDIWNLQNFISREDVYSVTLTKQLN